MNILNNLPLTKIKISLAKLLYVCVKVFVKGDSHIISRGGITYQVDLKEGLDLSLFLFGNFQSHVSRNKYLNLVEDAVVFDIGANVGMMTLQFAQVSPKGKVFAFEPTHYALAKLKKNIELNPHLSSRIKVVQTFVTSVEKTDKEIVAYSSWKVDGTKGEREHPVHQGTAMSAEGVGSITLDDFCENESVTRIDFIKIDTDGHEPDVLNGALKTITKYRPAIIFEVGQYVMREQGIDFSFYLGYFVPLGYKLANSSNLKFINEKNWRHIIPNKGTIDVLAYME